VRSAAESGTTTDTGPTRQVVEWLERDLGGKVTSIERQARWRPAWWATLDRGGEQLELYVRGDRLDSPSAFPLDHERVYQQMLAEQGIPVARVHGWSDDPKAYVMERVAGRDNFQGVPDDERRTVMEDYVDILVRLHQLDVRPFADAGIVRAGRPSESDRVGLRHFEQRAYRNLKKRPDPFLEFALGWLLRHRVDNHGREAAIVWDAGQFLHQGGRVTALLDLEFGHIGDPMMDLGGMWTRNPFIPFGDMGSLMRRYQERSGAPVDIRAVQYHNILWLLSNPLEFHPVLADPVPGSDYMLNLSWVVESNLLALEGIADVLGLELPEVAEPQPQASGYGPAHRHLTRALESAADDENGYARYRLRMAVRLARHAERVDEIGAAVVAADLDDLHKLLGRRPADWADGERQLEQFVLADEGRHDAQLVLLFHRRLHRALMTCGPSGSWITRHRVVPQAHL
jgi:aminoglycoside phosphotransferase (APT) family kinase protein